MAHVKAGGTAKNLRDSKPKMLGVKVYGNQHVNAGGIIVRQRGQRYRCGENTRMGKDHTIFATKEGKVKFKVKRIVNNGRTINSATFVSVV
ncbi:50S ribosomal protein L27 [candidate division Kazan bacterium]|uniref:Large ribosomal subunit protein bL27 n=1 Tax=candidate division Kazan bacterium TaxID=2202143 RepID=A0A420ZDX9_UNCK3|nr:MAG: 50S ribosomal protein L27 [candidate division Kazan bacterium]